MFYRIPEHIGLMPNIKQFIIDGNDVKNIRMDIIRCGTSRILKHIQQGLKSTNLDSKRHVTLNASTNIYPDRYINYSDKYIKNNYLKLI